MNYTSQKIKDKNEDTYSKDPYTKAREDFMKKRNSYYLICPDPQEITIETLPIPILHE